MRPSTDRLEEQLDQKAEKSEAEGRPASAGDLQDADVQSQREMMAQGDDEKNHGPGKAEAARWGPQQSVRDTDADYDEALSFWEPKPPKVLMEDPNEAPLELRSQIQLYATNEWVYAFGLGGRE